MGTSVGATAAAETGRLGARGVRAEAVLLAGFRGVRKRRMRRCFGAWRLGSELLRRRVFEQAGGARGRSRTRGRSSWNVCPA